ncbi:unnamed protein product [Mytilus edulis]|uniref:Uncharacterized protein n=1 Tax=Mytilus edulis TaxID=6550 RepID=A0A8S3SJP8_MYTED|nr:unnamed protein product [Mytilus edulis]
MELQECWILMCDSCKQNIHPEMMHPETHTVREIGKEDDDSAVISSVVNTYKTKSKNIMKVLCSNDDIIYYRHFNSEKSENRVVKTKISKSMKILQKVDIEIIDIALSSTDDLLFSTLQSPSELKTFAKSGEIKTLLDVSPMTIFCIHVNGEDEQILVLVEQSEPYNQTIAVFGTDHERKNQLYAIDEKDKDGNRRVVSFDMEGNIIFSYDGCERIKTDLFAPTDIVVTADDNIIITDMFSNALHVLNTNGELIALQNTMEYGIEMPESLSIDKAGYLLIGCDTFEKRKNPFANIYRVKTSENYL